MGYPLKTCTKCRLTKPLNDFYKSVNAKSGYKARCKECCDIDKELSKKPTTFKSKLAPDAEKAANSAAIGKLVKAHPSEFFALLAKERQNIVRKETSGTR